MANSNRASAPASAAGSVQQDVGVSADAAGHQVRALHRRALAGPHHARGAKSLPRSQHGDQEDGRSDHRQHVLADRPEGSHALPAQHYTGTEELTPRPGARGNTRRATLDIFSRAISAPKFALNLYPSATVYSAGRSARSLRARSVRW